MAFCCCDYDELGQAITWQVAPTAEDCHAQGFCVNHFQGTFPENGEGCNADYCNAALGGAEPFVGCCSELGPGVFDCEDQEAGPTFCRAIGGVPSCPRDCDILDCQTIIEGQPGPCCYFLAELCENLHRSECDQVGGQFFGDTFASCEEFFNQGLSCLQLGECRAYREPFYLPNDLQHTLQLCETAVLHFTRRPPEHWNLSSNQSQAGDNPGDTRRLELVSSHKAIGCANQLNTPDPCEQHYGFLVKETDGYLYPYFWSEPEANLGHARFNRGLFTKQACPDPQREVIDLDGQVSCEPTEGIDEPERIDRVPAGYVHARCGVEKRQWNEVAFYSDVERCGIYT